MRALLALVLVAAAAPAQAQLLDRVIAVVDEDIITHRELEQRGRIIVQQLQQAQVPLPSENELIGQILDSMVLGRLQVRYAQYMGVEIDEQLVDTRIEQIAQANQITTEQFRRRLAATGVRYEDFRSYMHEKALVDELQQAVSRQRVQISEADVDQFLRLERDLLDNNVRYHVRHILAAVSSAAGDAEIEEARQQIENSRARVVGGEPFAAVAVLTSDGQKALEGGDLGWRSAAALPAIAATEIALLEPGGMTDIIRTSSGFHLFYLEAREGTGQVLIEQTRARHILIRPDELNTPDEVRERLAQLRAQIVGGESFAELAQIHSQDTASSVEGGDLNWQARGKLDPVFEKQMSLLRPGEISEPFETRFGWHILRVEERRAVDETQQDLRRRATNYIAARRLGDTIQAWLLQLREHAYIRYLVSSGDDA